MTRMNAEIAKDFILYYPKLKEGYSLKRGFLRGGSIWALTSALPLLFLWFVSITDDGYLGEVMLVAFYILLSILPITTTLSIILARREPFKPKKKDSSERKNANPTGAISVLGVFGGSVGFVASRLFPLGYDNISLILMPIFAAIIVLLFKYFAISYFYKLHLLMKYCPELANETDMEALRDKYGIR